MSLHELSAGELATRLRDGDLTAEAVAADALARVEQHDPTLGAFRTIERERVIARARLLDRQRRRGEPCGRLHGIPVAIKDNICTRGIATTAGSRMLEGFVPPFDATVVSRLEAAGAVVLGKTNLDEFAMGSSTENSAFGPSRNPWNTVRAPGGSSGGSAVAVAARMAPLALGSDTGGSIRQPAAFCGVVGVKPTYGRVSRFGLLAFASSLDQIGPFSRSVADAATLLECIAGPDSRDATSAAHDVPAWSSALATELKGVRVGVPRRVLGDGVEAGVAACFETALRALLARGATLVDIELPHARYAIPVYYLIATAEASSNLARYDGVRYGLRAAGGFDDLQGMYEQTRERGFGEEVKRRIMLGTYVLSAGYYEAYYLKAQRVRTLLRQDYLDAFGAVDLVAMPVSPTPAFPLGERLADPLRMYLADVFTVSANLAGLPAISIPCGFADELPVGLQLTARPFEEQALFDAGHGYQLITEFHRQAPPLPARAETPAPAGAAAG